MLTLYRLWTAWGYLFFRTGEFLVTRGEREQSNCILWALDQKFKHGGSLLFVDSKFGPWLHCIWIDPDGHQWEYDPPSKHAVWRTPCRKRWQEIIPFFRTFPPMIFAGRATRRRHHVHIESDSHEPQVR